MSWRISLRASLISNRVWYTVCVADLREFLCVLEKSLTFVLCLLAPACCLCLIDWRTDDELFFIISSDGMKSDAYVNDTCTHNACKATQSFHRKDLRDSSDERSRRPDTNFTSLKCLSVHLHFSTSRANQVAVLTLVIDDRNM